jgi:hypothetical protein
MWVMLVPLLVGCRGGDLTDSSSNHDVGENSVETTASATVATTDTAPPPYIYTSKTEEKLPSLTPKQVETAISEGLAALVTIDPMALHTTYESFRAQSDDNCPYYDEDYYETYNTVYWGDACTTVAGTAFDGYAYSENNDGYYDGYNLFPEYRYFYGTARITDVDGNSWQGSGYSTYYQYHYALDTSLDTSSVYSNWSSYGSFERTGSFAEENWMDSGFSYEIYRYVGYYGYYPGAELVLDASISGLDTIAGTLDVNDFYIYSETLGSPCAEEAFGTISVRSDEGDWFEATFDGPPYWGGANFPAACDGCADLYFEGEVIGTVCPDFSVLSGWTVAPW